MVERSRRGPVGFRVLGAFKLVGALLLLGAGVGVFRLLGRDLGETLEHFAATFHLDPHSRYLDAAVAKVAGLDDSKLRAIGVGTILYAILYGAEGTGLVLGKVWGGYLTVVVTAALIPLEIWEVIRRPEPKRITVLVLNLAILVYVVWKLIQERRAARAAP